MKRISSNEIFDVLSNISDGVKVSLCYVSGVSVKKTKRSIDNDEFGKDLNSLDDREREKSWYSKIKDFQEQEKGKFPYKGVVRYSLYTLGWVREETYRKDYSTYKDKENSLRDKYGLERIKDRGEEKAHDELTTMGVSVGKTENTRNRSYIHLNTSECDKKTLCFGVNQDDSLTEEIPYSALRSIITKKGGDSGINQLKKLERSSEEIESYIKELESIKRGYEFRKFEIDKVLYLIIDKDGEMMYWVNDTVTNRISSELTLDNNSDLLRVSRDIFKETRGLIGENKKRDKIRTIVESVVKRMTKDN